MRYAAAAPLQAVTGDFRRLCQQASLVDVIKEVGTSLRKQGPSANSSPTSHSYQYYKHLF